MVVGKVFDIVSGCVVALFYHLLNEKSHFMCKMYNLAGILLCTVGSFFLHYYGFSWMPWVEEFFHLTHAHKTTLVIRWSFSFSILYFIIGFLCLGVEHEEDARGAVHIHKWAQKFVVWVVLLIGLLWVSESVIIHYVQTVWILCGFACMIWIAFIFLKVVWKMKDIASEADACDRHYEQGDYSRSLTGERRTFRDIFVVFSLIALLVALCGIAHITIVVEALHECSLVASVGICAIVAWLLCMVILYINFTKNSDVYEGKRRPYMMVQFFSGGFAITYFLWFFAIVDESSFCTGDVLIGSGMHIIAVIIAFCVTAVCGFVLTVDARAYHKNSIVQYRFDILNFFWAVVCCYLPALVCDWTVVRLEVEGYSEEVDGHIGEYAMYFDELCIFIIVAGLVLFVFKHIISVSPDPIDEEAQKQPVTTDKEDVFY